MMFKRKEDALVAFISLVFVLVLATSVYAIGIEMFSPFNTTYNTSVVQLNWTADESVSSCLYSLNGASNVSLCSPENELNDTLASKNISWVGYGSNIEHIFLPKYANITSAVWNMQGYLGTQVSDQSNTVGADQQCCQTNCEAQQFTAGATGYLIALDVRLSSPNISANSWMTVQIISDNSGDPGSTNITTQKTIKNSSSSGGTFFYLGWQTSETSIVTSGTKYWIKRCDTYDTDLFTKGQVNESDFTDTANIYSGGIFKKRDPFPHGNGSWISIARDVIFETYVQQYPSEVALDIANNGNIDNLTAGDFTYNWIFDLNVTALNRYLNSCTIGSSFLCEVPINVTSNTSGKMDITAINVTWDNLPNTTLTAVLNSNGVILWVNGTSSAVNITERYFSYKNYANVTVTAPDTSTQYTYTNKAGENESLSLTVTSTGDSNSTVVFNTTGNLSNSSLFIVTFFTDTLILTANATVYLPLNITANASTNGTYTGNITWETTDEANDFSGVIEVTATISATAGDVSFITSTFNINTNAGLTVNSFFRVENLGDANLTECNASLSTSVSLVSTFNMTAFTIAINESQQFVMTLSDMSEGLDPSSILSLTCNTAEGTDSDSITGSIFVQASEAGAGGGGAAIEEPPPIDIPGAIEEIEAAVLVPIIGPFSIFNIIVILAAVWYIVGRYRKFKRLQGQDYILIIAVIILTIFITLSTLDYFALDQIQDTVTGAGLI